MSDIIDELCQLLEEAGARAYWNTYYSTPEGKVRAFRTRAYAKLNGRKAFVRHVDPAWLKTTAAEPRP